MALLMIEWVIKKPLSIISYHVIVYNLMKHSSQLIKPWFRDVDGYISVVHSAPVVVVQLQYFIGICLR